MEPESKKPKVEDSSADKPSCNNVENSPMDSCNEAKDTLLAYHEFTAERTLLVNPQSKLIAVVGSFSTNPGTQGVIVAEKQPLTDESLTSIFSTSTKATKSFQNDIYSQYILHCEGGVGSLKVTSVYPATEAHINKYSTQSMLMVQETPDDYQKITKPFIESHPLSIDWVYNILDGTSERERVVFNDPDPEVGFVLLPDLKWDQKELNNLYMLAVVRKRGILSLRELRAQHLPLLKNVIHKGKEVIKERYGIPEEELRCYVHYQPSYYHFHVHFTHLAYNAPRINVGQSHLLEEIIDNIEIDPEYYAKRTMTFVGKRENPLWVELQKHRQ